MTIKDKRKKPSEYMKMAVEVMKNSIHERKKEDPSPYVGAVLVFPDGKVDSAYRGEFREGDHAEYTVLDKKNRNRELSECWLFVTLEPCAPGARNTPKISCSERIVDARIKDVWIGIEDKHPKVDHGGIDYLEDNFINIHQFTPELYKEIEELNREFMKWAKMKNVEEKAKKLKIENHLDERAASTNIDSLSVVALQKFLTESKKKYKPKSTEFLKELVEMDLLAYNEKSKTYLPTGNTILLFGKSPRNKFPQSSVKAKVHYGDGRIGTETFDDALVLIPDKVEDWLRKILPASLDRSKFKAQQIPSFPIEVVREAIINAIIHRDYSLDGAKVHLIVYPDKIVVKSPGKPIPPVTIESLKNFTATPYSRNKKLTFVFNEMDYMEETGVGMDTFRSQRPLPIYEYDGLNIVLTFPRILEAVKDVIHNEKIKILNNNELSSYDIFRNGKPLTKSEFVKQTGLPDRTAERLLKKFTDLKLLKKQGLGPSTNYIINE